MSLLLTPSIEKPSNIIPLPGNFIRPSFEVLYGFDAVVAGLAKPDITVVQFGDDGATISTTGVTGATSYTYERDTSASFPSPTTISSGTLDLTVNDTGPLIGSVTYYYRITATDGVDFATSDSATILIPGDFVTATLSDSTGNPNVTNTITFTVQPEGPLSSGSTLTLTGLNTSQTADTSLTLSGAGASIFGSSGSWTQSTGTLILTVDSGQTLLAGSDTVITFELQNSASFISGVTATLTGTGHNQANVSGTVLAVIFDNSLTFSTIQVFDNESTFINTNYADLHTIVHAKDTDMLYVWDGSAWVLFKNNP